MLVVTSETIADRRIVETLGLVRGATVRSKHIGTDFVAGLRNLVGGEQTGYSALMAGAREQALDRMIEAATELQADAIVAVRMETSAIMAGASEIVAYGTAVKLE
ncbi:YbjQ family protein [Tateyamaria sp. ANG-S1]|uniref:YbjQ family protein n=1 Tax=Tateyamaria sp. ANG-S1 TaxID=1577905 RepID=UPI00057F5309|nr:YbjQ family protein [Tateyamaria sp. ANG-S1]KIC48899.1 hypothetical protein RA29_14655 [Tateyamaria sp. ANG-S1]